ncbi:hypothetical protein PTSG_05579 [Salpingoeca rosetta]|uniref:Uncharacterized protein n=1 Tax=Salpingoeca rosetta (strain ATCC 50818 / BSB-021) TaxID=946362 RepID=F2UBL8_SALR5|nr:uncharacterized protein PTSG_05579 [Salpingoeca rosetta]EGD73884.1 hypothetical protein PTSG_05579 [Salpingoeca rosetta]|eukprot:XP_004993447.1 hypothetical protein PTSG_05579 [Salpingoeca rosetta]
MEVASSMQTLIDNVNAAEPNFAESVRRAEDCDENIESELQMAKDHMSKLKFNFVEMKTKAGFLDKLGTYEIGSTPACGVSEEDKTETKAQVQSIKAANRDLQDAIQETAHAVLDKRDEFQQQSADALSMMEKFKALEQRVQEKRERLRQQQERLGQENSQPLSHENVESLQSQVDTCRQRIEEQRDFARVHSDKVEACKATLQQATTRKEQLQAEVEACAGHVAAALNQKRADVLAAVSTVSKLAGAEILSVSATAVEVKLSVLSGRTSSRRHVHITRQEDTGIITQILLDGSSAYSKALLAALYRTGATTSVRVTLALVRQMLSAPADA